LVSCHPIEECYMMSAAASTRLLSQVTAEAISVTFRNRCAPLCRQY
jgi:hypothetical protein